MRNVVSWKPLVLGASFLLYGAGTAFATETDHLYPTPSTGFMSVQQDGRQINCHIVDKSGPIVGANVVVKGTTIGNISDMDGRAIIENVPANAILVVSYIGYVTQEVIRQTSRSRWSRIHKLWMKSSLLVIVHKRRRILPDLWLLSLRMS